jgi:cytidylate kinase
MMPVIAMTREMGSGGKDVAELLANRLDLQIVHHELVEHDIAEKMGVRESTVHKFLESGPNIKDRLTVNRFELALHTTEEVLSLAEKGGVIIRGWGASRLLRPVRHVLSLRVCAPMDRRVETLMARVGLDDPVRAEQEIHKNDEAHRRVLRGLFDADWENPLHYDLVLNTAQLPIETCAGVVVELLGQPAFRVTPKSRSALGALKIEAHIRSLVLGDSDLRHTAAYWRPYADADSGTVTLTGGVANAGVSDRIADIVQGVAGVRVVQNDMMVSSRYASS